MLPLQAKKTYGRITYVAFASKEHLWTNNICCLCKQRKLMDESHMSPLPAKETYGRSTYVAFANKQRKLMDESHMLPL